jgi:solute carrier family 25 protein 38
MPITVIKVRYESSMYSYATMAAASRDILRAEGVRGFFSGWGATAVRDAPYAGLYVVFYEQGKTWMSALWDEMGAVERGMDGKTAAVVNVVSGAGAGALATAITNPFDTLKTRIQVAPEKYRNLWHAAKVVIAEDGRWKGRALFDGLGLRIARKAVSSAVVWGIYEGLVR